MFIGQILNPIAEALKQLDFITNGKIPNNNFVIRNLIAIGYQESQFQDRVQILDRKKSTIGKARGFWQFELTGVTGVLKHKSTKNIAGPLAHLFDIPNHPTAWHYLITGNDVAAATLARLLMYTDPHKVPITADETWDMYLRCWNPGKPYPEYWPTSYTIGREIEFKWLDPDIELSKSMGKSTPPSNLPPSV